MIPYITVDHVSAIGNLGVALAAGFAAWQGIKSLNVWRQEKLGSRRIDLAEEALLQVYEAENALRIIRSPFGYVGEAADRESDSGESHVQKRYRDTAFVAFERGTAQQAKFDQLHIVGLRLKAHFGRDYVQPLDEIRNCLHAVRAAAATLYEVPYNGFDDPDLVNELEGDVWAMGRRDLEDGKIGAKLKAAVERAEVLLTPHLQSSK